MLKKQARVWLNPITSDDHGTVSYRFDKRYSASAGGAELRITDCSRSTQLDFFWGDLKGAKERLKKLEILEQVVGDFIAYARYQIYSSHPNLDPSHSQDVE